MLRLFSVIVMSVLTLLLSACNIEITVDPLSGRLGRLTSAVEPTVPPSIPLTSTVGLPHMISLQPNTAVVTDALTLSKQTFIIDKELYRTSSVAVLGEQIAQVSLALARPVTDVNRPPLPPATSDAPWVALLRSDDVAEVSCTDGEPYSWLELRPLPMSGSSAETTPPPVIWDRPVTTLCRIPPQMPIADLENNTWCHEVACTTQSLWVDLAVVSGAPGGVPQFALYRFIGADGNPSGGDNDQHVSYCRSIGCNGGGSNCFYCWVNGCGC
jgi:hypothetical protein